MMKYLLISWLLFGCLPPAIARDPFAQLRASCLSSVASLEQWQLQGMVGKGNRYLGWLRSTQGERVAIASDRPLPFEDWQIDAFAPFHLTLSAPQSCVPQRVTLQIKGKYHDKDRSRAAAAERRGTGQ
ncbi:HofP DNA utilization family protein [Mixta theicola]|nr:HofP DNA utilization family protein [Mixta theicola]